MNKIAYTAYSFGFVPIPLRGKVPLISEWNTITLETCLEYLDSHQGNVGVVTGRASGIVVLDVDQPDSNEWQQYKKIIPQTFTVKTGKGYHYYFNYIPEAKSCKVKGIGDFKSDNGQVVFAGSIHPDTLDIYSVVDGYIQDKKETSIILADLPKELYKIIPGL